MQSENNRINDVVFSAMKNMENIVDVNTVVGRPINTDAGDCIIPVSKVVFGVLAGGGEYGKTTIFKSSSDLPFSAGNGTVVSVKPCGFLIKSNGEYKVLSVGTSNMEAVIDKVSDFFTKINKGDDDE